MDIKKDMTDTAAAIRKIIPDATEDEMAAMAWIKFCTEANRHGGYAMSMESKHAAQVIQFLRSSGCSK